MVSFTRRTLLTVLGATAAAPSAFGATAKARRGVVIGSMRGLNRATQKLVYALQLIDLDSQQRRSVTLDFFAHGVAFDPKKPGRAMLFEKKGAGACEVDLDKGEVLRPLKTREGRAFYGHGTFSKDGATLFVAENQLATQKGLVSVWDGASLAALGEFPTWGENPHDCLLADDGKTLVVTNGGGHFPDGDPPCVCFIDIRSRKLLEKLTLENPRINAGHVALSKQRHVALVSAPRDGLQKHEPGAISIRSGSSGPLLSTMASPAEVTGAMRGETLSLSIHEHSGTVGATNPDGNQLSFWSLVSPALVKAVSLENPRGLTQTLDGEHFVVSHGAKANLVFFSTRTLDAAPGLTVEETGISGSHLYTWAGSVH